MSEPLQKKTVEAQIDALKKYLRYDIRYSLPRPFIIEFTGPPSSGKTTVVKEIDDYLRPLGLAKIYPPNEAPREIRHIARLEPDYNMRTALYTLSQLLDEAHSARIDMLLIDRGPFDAYCWPEYWLNKGKITLSEKENLQSYYTNRQFISKVDICYFLVCEAETALQRELRVAIDDSPRETTNLESMKRLERIWRNAQVQVSTLHPNVRLIDTTNMTEVQMIKIIAADLLNTLEQKTKKGL
ncbi:MAG: hypothetical protein A3B99_01470 [Candidatus Yanofskybacteria bacterium RIFCSPHIGHO2_02_FULL_44_12b]|uniref:NadR/Ttd14 AAA domain-containing protein n=2 Tax=Candidatus Yanofskyibacteriota TaxID=1752733 RepID=A0A1F8GIQ8_9BACT|nr:MAG: hypothetical protein UW79_C0030G0001 [Candidatus Yanofskybacteria bacterium GW2011_GWA2_44_9]OGN05598.1 MAG: hypothetical protein A2659_04810 [Candidatus Yanofskybacteria bacterium RIFCSPHIGHO2_01_FULL_44_24]OGN14003.1 MAG: hypothetical protein A3B99_01470 [Candidatus Yanofskybacteria bacterium RIFCSPHIGHO2_02_FULL_44_12b]OGN25272.1 MAG: hypothetical protein A2925_01590 [Candidatus Yanofskybacteria bacterium RIFCSPLOWO2_01_FULL_44_22]